MAGIKFDDLISAHSVEEEQQPTYAPTPEQPAEQPQAAPDNSPSYSLDDYYQKMETQPAPEAPLAINNNKSYVAPVEEFNPYTTETPQALIDSQNRNNEVFVATQEYADRIQEQVIRDHNGYLADENYQGTWNPTLTNQVYDYLKRMNKGADDTVWQAPNPENDLFSVHLPKIEKNEETIRQAKAELQKPLPTAESDPNAYIKQKVLGNAQTDAQREVINATEKDHGYWELMSPWDKFKFLIVPGSSATTVENQPEWAKYIQNIIPSVMAGSGAGMLGSLIPIPGAGLATGLAAGGLTYASSVGLIDDVPVINDVLEAIDLGEKVEPYVGTAAALGEKSYENLYGKRSIDEVIQSGDFDMLALIKEARDIYSDPDNKYMLDVAKYSYEVGADYIDDVARILRNAGASISDKYLGTDFGQRDESEVSLANIGIGGLIQTSEDTYGAKSLLNTYVPIYTSFVDEAMNELGMSEKEAKDFAHQNLQEMILNQRGTTGLVNDFVSQSVVDPANLAPLVQGKTAEVIGRVTGDDALKFAGKSAQGSLLVDLSGPLQPVIESITGLHGSQGMDTIVSQYKKNIQSMYDTNNLSAYQRHIAGITPEGKIKDMQAFKPSGNAVKDYIAKLVGQTEDSKMFDVTQMTSDFLGSTLFNDDVKISNIPSLVEEIAGLREIAPDSPLASFKNTAVLNTLQDQFAGVRQDTVNAIAKDIQSYRQFGVNRAVVDQVAQSLNMSPNEIFDALDNVGLDAKDQKIRILDDNSKKIALDSKRQDLYRKIREAGVTYTDADGTVLSPDQVIKKIEVFKKPTDDFKNSVGRKQYSETALKASVMTTLADMADTFNLIRFGIEPDSWATRMSGLAKSLQSIALLNFSTSYQVNNFLNNMITRSVSGVGGRNNTALTDIAKARGLTFARGDTDINGNRSMWDRTSEKIKKAKKGSDALQKLDDWYRDATKDKHILQGVQLLDIEESEKNAAFNIGTNRYWSAVWPEMIPDMRKQMDSLGISKDVQNQIFKVALDSPNLETAMNKIMGEVILPGAESTLAQTLANGYDTGSAQILRDFFAKKSWIQDAVDEVLQTGDSRMYDSGFENLIDRITNDVSKANVVQLDSTFDDLKVRYANEGIGAVSTGFEAMIDLYAKLWIDQTKENSTLFLDRVAGRITAEDFSKEYTTRMNIQTNDYRIARGYTLMNIGAMIEGLGLDTEIGTSLMTNAMQFYDLGEQYIKREHQLYQKYATPESQNYDFQKYSTEKVAMLTEMLDSQTEVSNNIHKDIVKYLRDNLDEEWTGHIDRLEQSFKDIYEANKAENKAEIKDLNERIKRSGARNRENVSIRQEKPRIARKENIYQMLENSAKYLKQMESALPLDQTKAAPSTIEQTLRIEMMYDEARNMGKRSADFLKKGKKDSEASKVYEPINYENSKVKTSFLEYGKEVLKQKAEEAVKAGIDPLPALQRNHAQYAVGEAVTLGTVDASKAGVKFLDPETRTWVDHPVLDHFQLLNPNADPKVTGSKFSMARSEPYMYGGNIVNAGVFYQGKIIAYITEGMRDTVTVDGKTFPVIGVSPTDPNALVLYVQDKPRVVTPGKPKNVEYSIYAQQNFHPGGIGTTPSIQPFGKAALENSFVIRDLMRRWKEQAKSDLSKGQSNGSLFGKLSDQQRVGVMEYLDGDLRQAYNAMRFQTQRYGETMVDAALLNYNHRYGFDNALTMAVPYQYWMTRSIANWGRRMISQPAWFSMYHRIEELIEKNKKDFLPTALEGKVGLLGPNMGDGMGSAFFFDPFKQLLPMQQFYHGADYFVKNLNTIHKNTITQIDEMYKEGIPFNGQEITDDMYNEAMQSKGDLYWTTFQQVRENDESDTSVGGLLGTFLSPPVWFDMAYKHMTGRDKDISYSPMFRTGNLVKAVGDETWAENITNFLGDVLQAPERGIRTVMGIPTGFDKFGGYGVMKQLANMQTQMEISGNDVRNALAEGPGNQYYDEAVRRYQQRQAYKMQTGALATEIGQSLGGNKDTSLGQLALSGLVSLFGGDVLPEGDLKHREDQKVYYDMVKQLGKDSEVYKQFWKDRPDYDAHNYAKEDDPDVLLHKVLLDNLEEAYYALNYSQQDRVKEAFGDRFTKLFATKETRATDSLSNDEIIQWTRALNGNVPNISDDQLYGPEQEAQQIKWYSESVLSDYDKFEAERDRKFPGIKEVESGYYDTDSKLRNQYKIDNPMLQEYWDWKEGVLRANPALATYVNMKSASDQVYYKKYDSITDALMGKINDWTRSELDNFTQYGLAMKPSTEQTLRTLYYGIPGAADVPYEEWLKSLVLNK